MIILRKDKIKHMRELLNFYNNNQKVNIDIMDEDEILSYSDYLQELKKYKDRLWTDNNEFTLEEFSMTKMYVENIDNENYEELSKFNFKIIN